MRYVYDTEFLEDGREQTIGLISLGAVAEDGREFYAVNADAPWADIARHDWLCKNVVPHLPLANGAEVADMVAWANDHDGVFGDAGPLPFSINYNHPYVKPRKQIGAEFAEFLLHPDTQPLELWAYYGAYDHVVTSWLWGRMPDRPADIPIHTRDLMDLWELAGQPTKPAQTCEHDALADARWGGVADAGVPGAAVGGRRGPPEPVGCAVIDHPEQTAILDLAADARWPVELLNASVTGRGLRWVELAWDADAVWPFVAFFGHVPLDDAAAVLARMPDTQDPADDYQPSWAWGRLDWTCPRHQVRDCPDPECPLGWRLDTRTTPPEDADDQWFPVTVAHPTQGDGAP